MYDKRQDENKYIVCGLVDRVHIAPWSALEQMEDYIHPSALRVYLLVRARYLP
jgi:hypothetical protein